MAPDLNTVPPPPPAGIQTTRTSAPRPRRTSEIMSPPPPPLTSSSIPLTTAREAVVSQLDNTGVGSGPGPMRHPLPLTPTDLYMQLEKEQEAVVNRLTRKLSLLQQQSASVASINSSVSGTFLDLNDHSANHLLSGGSLPTPSLRHRSSSSLSTRSINAIGVDAGTVSGIAPARDSAAPVLAHARETLSRQNSVASRRSETSSPSLSSSLHPADHFPPTLAHPPASSSAPQQPSVPQLPQQAINPLGARQSTHPATLVSVRCEEVTLHRSEMEAAKRENAKLRRRIQELERSLSSSRRGSSIGQDINHTGQREVAPRGLSAEWPGHGYVAQLRGKWGEDGADVPPG